MSKGWDNATIKKLKALTGKGLSTAEIGKRLGISKNAVVGKLNRMGWNAKAVTPTAPEKKAASTKKTTTTKAPANTKKTTTKKSASTAKAATAAPRSNAAPKAKKDTTVKASAKKTTAKTTKKETTPKATSSAAATPTDKKSLNKNLAMHQRIIQHSLEMANLKPNQCRWPIGDPDSENFHFCGETVFVGKPYCYEHCKQAYQFTPPKKK